MNCSAKKTISDIGRALVRPFCHAAKDAAAAVLCTAVLSLAILSLSPAVPARADEADYVTIRVEGQYEKPDEDAIVSRINEIRMEACREGIPSPVTGEPLTPQDYRPVQWSQTLADAAGLRAAEASVLHAHIRPNGQDFDTASAMLTYAQEVLAWGFEGTPGAIDGWYTEKASYLQPELGPAGHYMALISPANLYVGFADLSGYGGRDVCAGMLSDICPDQADAGGGSDQREAEKKAETVVYVETARALLPEAVDCAVGEAALRIQIAGRFRTSLMRQRLSAGTW